MVKYGIIYVSTFFGGKKMRVKVTTETGEKFDFIFFNERVYFSQGVNSIAEVISLNEPIEVGKPIVMKFYGKTREEPMFLKSSPVKDISVYLK